MSQHKLNVLKSVFGYPAFRPLQEECIDAVLAKQDTLLIMPTGGGKSLCYQVPAIMSKGLTVVVSPLISLMKDQVSQLKAAGVEADVLNSTLSIFEYRENKARVLAGTTKLLFCAPETLIKEETLQMLSSCRVECITVDEAHCISEWGHDFRPEYRKIKGLRPLFPNAVFLAVTATATHQVRKDIIANLGLKKPLELVASFNRGNLFYTVIPKTKPTEQTLAFMQKFKGQSGIIYCFSRKQVDQLSREINRQGIKALPYHAGLTDETRHKNQELFIRDDVPVMVATIAFGMGINKPNVRFVVHYDLPKNIESYYQETGRAGRDGLPSTCLLLFSAGDAAKIRYFIEQKTDTAQKVAASKHLNAMLSYAQARQCRRVPLITYFGEAYDAAGCGACDNCVNPAPEAENLTIEAVKFLRCMSETGERFGAVHVINVLRGSKLEKVMQYKHNTCKTFGAGNGLSVKEWQHIVQQMLEQKVLAKDEEYGVLKFNDQSLEILANRRPFKGHRLPKPEESLSASALPKELVLDYDQYLFDKLRAKRKELADIKGVPPYVIFSDKTLIDMCRKKPKTRAQFAEVYGVGEQKLNWYGNMFIHLINS